ncbi:hypothetical protein ACV3Q3_12895 [Clostridium perfringens]
MEVHRINDFKEGKYYHQLGKFGGKLDIIDTNSIFFIKNNKIFRKYSSGKISECLEPHNIVINAKFTLADTFIDFKFLKHGEKVKAKINGEWRDRYYISSKKDKHFDDKRELIVSPVNPLIEKEERYYELAEAIMLENDCVECINWRI